MVDIVVAGVLLLGARLILEILIRKMRILKCRIAICLAIILTCPIIWAEIAVGILGTPIAGNINLVEITKLSRLIGNVT